MISSQARSATGAQQCCEAAVLDGTPRAIHDIAQLGANGTFPGNVERDLHRLSRRLSLNCGVEPYWVETTVVDRTGVEKPACIPMILPHEIMNSVWTMDQNEFSCRFVGADGECEQIWHRSLFAGNFSNHPSINEISEQPQHHIPIRLHEDDGPMTRHSSLLLIQLTSALVFLSSMLSRYICIALPLSILIPDQTLAPLFEALIWSMMILAAGMVPSLGHLGNTCKPTVENAQRIQRWASYDGPFQTDIRLKIGRLEIFQRGIKTKIALSRKAMPRCQKD